MSSSCFAFLSHMQTTLDSLSFLQRGQQVVKSYVAEAIWGRVCECEHTHTHLERRWIFLSKLSRSNIHNIYYWVDCTVDWFGDLHLSVKTKREIFLVISLRHFDIRNSRNLANFRKKIHCEAVLKMRASSADDPGAECLEMALLW